MSCKPTSRLKRASLTCELAGFGAAAEVDRDLLEWNYGSYDGRTSADIHAERPDWLLFRDGYPGGEMPAGGAARADRVVSRSGPYQGRVGVLERHFGSPA
jgi:broad specificity phosphatase PhoE